jgi:FkbM family methyltransferase
MTILEILAIIKKYINKFLQLFGLELVTTNSMNELTKIKKSRSYEHLNLLLTLPSSNLNKLISLIPKSKSQITQDLFVISESNFKKNGFFVEFGATDGINFSNTYMLEKEFNWNGILVEPAKVWWIELLKNRPNVVTESLCVWKESNVNIEFNETKNSQTSTIDLYTNSDLHRSLRKKGKKYLVKTITLMDLLQKYNAPKIIDYLSIDTEGSEFEILNTIDFNKYTFKIITCEHNYTENKEQVFNLLTKNGYIRKYENLSNYDDWYVLNSTCIEI